MIISKIVILIAVIAASIGGYVIINTYPLKSGEVNTPKPDKVITPFGVQNNSQAREAPGILVSVEPFALSMAKGESRVITISVSARNLTENTSINLGIQRLFPTEQLPTGIKAKFDPETINIEPDQKVSSNLTLSIDQTAEEREIKLQIIPTVSTTLPISIAGKDIIDLTIRG